MGLKDILIKIGTAFDAKGSKEAQAALQQVEQRAIEAEENVKKAEATMKQALNQALEATNRAYAAEKALKDVQEQAKETAKASDTALKPVSTPPDTKGAEATKAALKEVETQAKQTQKAVTAASSEGWGMSMKGQEVAPLPGSYRYKDPAGDQAKSPPPAQASAPAGLLDGFQDPKAAAQQMQDLATAKERVATAQQKEAQALRETADAAAQANPQLDTVANLQRAQLGLQIAQSMGAAAGRLREFAAACRTSAPEASKMLETTAATMDVLESAVAGASTGATVAGGVGAAAGAALGAIKAPLSKLIELWGEEKRQRGELQKQWDALMKGQRDLARQVAADQLAGTLDKQAAAIERINAALEANQRIQAAQRGAAAAERETKAARDIRGGANEQGVQAGLIEAEFKDKLQALGTGLEKANQNVKNLEAQTDQAKSAAQQAANNGLANFDELDKKAKALQGQLDDATQERDTQKAEFEAKRKELVAQTTAQFDELTSEVGDSVTEAGKKAIDIIQQKATEQGGKISDAAARAWSQLADLLNDRIDDEQQAPKIAQLIASMRGSQEGRDKQIFEHLTGLATAVEESGKRYSSLTQQIQGLQAIFQVQFLPFQ